MRQSTNQQINKSLILAFFLLAALPLRPQGTSGSITGNLKDASGAIVPGS